MQRQRKDASMMVEVLILVWSVWTSPFQVHSPCIMDCILLDLAEMGWCSLVDHLVRASGGQGASLKTPMNIEARVQKNSPLIRGSGGCERTGWIRSFEERSFPDLDHSVMQ